MSDLLTWMDGARIVVAYNGADFDMRRAIYFYVLKRAPPAQDTVEHATATHIAPCNATQY